MLRVIIIKLKKKTAWKFYKKSPIDVIEQLPRNFSKGFPAELLRKFLKKLFKEFLKELPQETVQKIRKYFQRNWLNQRTKNEKYSPGIAKESFVEVSEFSMNMPEKFRKENAEKFPKNSFK